MSILLNTDKISKSYSQKILFENLSFSVFKSDRVGLIGPNGSGKSTLLKILAGIEQPDSGHVIVKKGVKIAYVPQSISYTSIPIKEVLMNALADSNFSMHEKGLNVERWLNIVGFTDSSVDASTLSGGWQKRLSIAQAAIQSPDLLLLDEPTNHLDLEALLWLETFLQRKNFQFTFVLVSHDRFFLENVCNKIVEISPAYPDGVFLSDGRYLNFLQKKNDFLQGQIAQEKSLLSKARREKHWLQQGAKARTTKSRSRIDKAEEIFEELKGLKKRNEKEKAKIDFISSERKTRKLLTLTSVSKSINGKNLFKNLNFVLSPKTRIGLVGPNGCGKTTILKLINEELTPDSGTIKKADDLKIVYFDQHKMLLDENMSLKQALCPQGEFVNYNGRRIHINSWCQRFLFPKDSLEKKIKSLSGGEKARIAIAHLLLKPADILLLDEPTNDLDIQTLEALEESLLEFHGAIILITHDRFLIDRVCNLIISLDKKEDISKFSGYCQYEKSKKILEQKSSSDKNISNQKKETTEQGREKKQKQKLSYNEKKEYENMAQKIEKLEKEIEKLNTYLNENDLSSTPEKMRTICSDIALHENEIERLYLRWAELDAHI